MILVDLEQVAAHRPDRPLFENLSVTISGGDRLGVVGRNGSGKSTLLRVMAGLAPPEDGAVRRGRDVRVAFLDQHPTLPAGPVAGAVPGGAHWEAAAILERLGMGGMLDADVATLSGGQAKRVALARVLVQEVDLLVLDEPTNHLDLDAITWLESRLAGFRGGLVLVTHDRHVLDRLTTRMLELDRGRGHVHHGGYAGYLEARAERVAAEATADAVRRNLARAELAWLRRGAPARTRKPKARIASATAVVQGTGPVVDRPGDLELAAAGGRGAGTPRLGDKVVVLEGVGHRFAPSGPLSGEPGPSGPLSGKPGPGGWLFSGVDLDLEPGGRLGIVGPNGSGKTTLLAILAGRTVPAAGRVDIAPTVRIGYYEQAGLDVDPTLRVRDVVAGPAAQPTWEQARLMERFWFDADAQWAPVGTLSGGEARRLQLLLVLARLPNVLLLDEPTNDLDLDTLRALEDHLETWPGSLVVVSHDRALLERTVEDVLVLDGAGGVAPIPGGFAAYEAGRRAAAGRPLAPSEPAARKLPSAPEAGAGPPKSRSSSTLRRLLGVAERQMAEAAAERDRLAAEVGVAGGDHVALAAVARSLASAEAQLAEAEERWLALAEELGA